MPKPKKPDGYTSFLASDSKYLQETAKQIKEKAPLEEIRFNLLNQTLESLGIEVNPYASVSLEVQKTPQVENLANESFEILSKEKLSSLTRQHLESLWNYLSESDEPQKADLIFVFGGQGVDRVRRAVELYKSGYGPKVLFTGKKAAYMGEVEESEAEYLSQIAIDAGVPPEAIVLEKEAINSVGNAVNSTKLLRQMGLLPEIIIAIQHSFQMRRSYLTLRANMDWSPKIIRQAVAAEKFTRDNYYKDHEGWNFVFYEYIKLYGARLMKHF